MQSSNAVFLILSFEEILDDLSSRFIINVPEAELASVERICFQVEQAHWFYEDFIRELRPDLPSFQLKTFSAKIFKHCPLLHQWAHEHERAYADFMQYRFRIPVCGAIILNVNLDKCLLVKGWSSKSGWGFPRGKINQDEEYDCCAVREVLEETGFDVGPYLKKSDYIELTMREQRIRLYIIQGVSEDTEFVPRTRKEISQISWIKLDDLPTYKQTEGSSGNSNLNYAKSGSHRFYMVVPFINKLRHFVTQRKKALRKDNNNSNKKIKGSASPLPNKGAKTTKSVNTPPSPSNQKPTESTDALKSLLGVNNHKTNNKKNRLSANQNVPVASPAASQPQPDHQPPSISGNLLDQLFSQQQQQQSSPIRHQQEPTRASFVEDLLKQQQQQPPFLMNNSNSDNLRRNSLLSVLQGRSNHNQTPSPSSTTATIATTPMMNSIEAFLQSQQAPSQPYFGEH